MIQQQQTTPTRSGKILVLFAILLPAIFGMIGLTVDGGILYSESRQLQNAVDAAATAGATKILEGESDEVVSAATAALLANQPDNITYEIHYPPVSGPFAGDSDYVTVEVTQTVPTWFMQAVNFEGDSSVYATATAGVEATTSAVAVIVLDPDPPGLDIPLVSPLIPPLPSLIAGMEVLGLGKLEVDGAVIVNNGWGGYDEHEKWVGEFLVGRHALACTPLLPLTRVKATDFRVVGGVDSAKHYSHIEAGESVNLQVNARPVRDPLMNLPVPTTMSDPANVSTDYHGGVSVVNLPLIGGTPRLKPGVYDWIQILVGPVIFEPGIYVIRGKHPITQLSLNITTGPVWAEGVMFYLTDTSSYSVGSGTPDCNDDDSAPDSLTVLSLLPSTLINLALPGTNITGLNDPGSPFHNMVIYQRRADRRPIVMAQQQLIGSSKIAGRVYAKWGHVTLVGQGDWETSFAVGSFRAIDTLGATFNPSEETKFPAAEDVFLVD